jgi:MFS family permease
MSAGREPIFTPRFLGLCLLSFTAAAGAFALLPAVPFRIRALGGGTATSGFFLGALTYASAFSAPWTGALGDRVGRRRLLRAAGVVIAALAVAYALIPVWWVLVLLAVPHGVLWSGLLTSASAYVADVVPATRRAEAIAYHGMSTTLAIALAPAAGFWLAERDWRFLCGALVVANLAIAIGAGALPGAPPPAPAGPAVPFFSHRTVAWEVVAVGGTLFLVALGYGGLTSFSSQYAVARGIAPKEIYFTSFAWTIVLARPLVGPRVDRFGARRSLPFAILLAAAGLAALPLSASRGGMIAVGMLFGAGFSFFYPAFAALVLDRTPPERRGAAFGAMLAAFDTGIGTGSIVAGPLVASFGYGVAFGGAALAALAAWPFLRWAEPRFLPAPATSPE